MGAQDQKRPLSIGSLRQIGGEGMTHPIDANTFVVKGEYPVMIECGSKFGYSHLKQNLGEVGLKVSDIKIVLATHGHWDHISGMELMAQESDAELLVPEEDAAGVENGSTIETVAYYYEQAAHPIVVAGKVAEGFCLKTDTATITAIKTPWHTPGSVCYRVEQPDSVTLIAADTLYGFYFPSEGRSITDDLEGGRKSLELLREESYDYMAIGHAVLGFMDDVDTRLEEAQRQFAPAGVLRFVEENASRLPLYINPWQKPSGQSFRY